MKRTQQNPGYIGTKDKLGVSGCRMFDGEDLYREERLTEHKRLMTDNYLAQAREKKFAHDKERALDREYAQEIEEQNRMRGMLEDENNKRRADLLKAMQEENQRLAQSKKDKEKKDKDDEEAFNQEEVGYRITLPRGEAWNPKYAN